MGITEAPPAVQTNQPDRAADSIPNAETYLASLVDRLLTIGPSGEIILSQIYPYQTISWETTGKQLKISIKGTFRAGMRAILTPGYEFIYLDTYLASKGPYPIPAHVDVYTHDYFGTEHSQSPRPTSYNISYTSNFDKDLAQQIPRQGIDTLPRRIDCTQTAAAIIELALRFHNMPETDPSRNKPTNLSSLLVIPATETPTIPAPA